MADRKKIYDQLAELMKGDSFGYGKELSDGEGGFERLLDEGTIAGRNGKRIPGEKDRNEKDRANMLGKLLESGEPIYIYKKGEVYPREVRLDKKSERLMASPKRLDELRPEEQIQKPRKPSLMDRYFDFIAKMFGGRWDACRKWDSYNNQQDALKNVRAQKRIDRRRRFDPILNGTEKPEKQREQNAPEKAPETKAVQQNPPAQNAPEAEKQLSPELRLLRNLEKEKQLQEQLRQLREENATLEKELAGKGSVKNEKTEPTLTENEQQIKADKKLAKELQKEENKKYIEEQQQIKSDEKLAKSLQEEEYKNQGTKPDEAQELNESFIEMSPEKEKKLQGTDISQFLKDNAKDEPKPEEKQEKREPDEVDDLLSKLKGGDANKQLPENVEKNLRKLYTDAQKSRRVLTDALNDPKNEKLAGGNTISNIVAYENIKNNINVMEGDQELIDNISSKDFVRNWKGAARLSPDVVYASDYPHDKRFFEKNVLSEKGMQKLSNSMDRGVNKVILQQGLVQNGLGKERDLFWGPSNEAEKMAMRDEEREKMGPPQEDEIKVGKQPRKPTVNQSSKVNEPKLVRVTHHPLEQNQPTNQPQPGGPAMM